MRRQVVNLAGQTWGKKILGHSFSKLNTLGKPLGHRWGTAGAKSYLVHTRAFIEVMWLQSTRKETHAPWPWKDPCRL